MRGPPKERGPAVATPGHDLNAVSTQDRDETYAEPDEFSTAATAAILPFRAHGRTVRAICIVPDGDGQCRSVLSGRPLHFDLGLSFRGPLWKVQMMLEGYRRGLPVHVHPDCILRAGA